MLSDSAIRAAKPRQKPFKLFDAGGLHLIVTPSGSRWWRWNYRMPGASGEGREGATSRSKTISLGTYPDVPLKRAREKRDEARRLLKDGKDPSAERAATKLSRQATFRGVALEWFGKNAPNWAPTHSDKIKARLENFVFPMIGSKPVTEVRPQDLVAVIRKIEARGTIETAHRTLQSCGSVLKYGIATYGVERNFAADIVNHLAPAKEVHHPTITEPRAVGALLRAIDGYAGQATTAAALKLAPLTFVRPGELRAAEWKEFDLQAALWRIPKGRMKMGEQHLVPLSSQAVGVVSELRPLTGGGRFLFPAITSTHRPMSANTVNGALRRLGYSQTEMTGHGFRSMASTLLHELGWNHQVIERQLAHGERNAVVAAYNFAEHLPERTKMMQAWADYLDGLRKGAGVVPIRRSS